MLPLPGGRFRHLLSFELAHGGAPPALPQIPLRHSVPSSHPKPSAARGTHLSIRSPASPAHHPPMQSQYSVQLPPGATFGSKTPSHTWVTSSSPAGFLTSSQERAFRSA